MASIEAAAHPAHVSYLYYVAGADGCGEQVFSNTLAEFEVNAAAYKAAVARAGGHPPHPAFLTAQVPEYVRDDPSPGSGLTRLVGRRRDG